MFERLSTVSFESVGDASRLFLDYLASPSKGLPPFIAGVGSDASFWKERADAAADRDAIHHGQERVEHDEVEVQSPRQRQGFHPVHRVHEVHRPDVEDLTEKVARRGVARRDEDRRSSGGRLAHL